MYTPTDGDFVREARSREVYRLSEARWSMNVANAPVHHPTHVKPVVVVVVSLGVFLGFYLASLFSVWPINMLVVHAQAATEQVYDVAQAETTATAVSAQFKLTKVYQDSLYTVNYPEGWVTQTGPRAVALASNRQVIAMIQEFGIPAFAPGQIEIQIMNGVIDAKIKPGVSNVIVNVNCTSCHVIGDATIPKPDTARQSTAQLSLSPVDVARSIAREYGRTPLNLTFGQVQPFLWGEAQGVEASITAQPNDGMLIVFYSNNQLVNVVVSVPSGELPKDQPLIEAIVSTIRETQPDAATPAATVSDGN